MSSHATSPPIPKPLDQSYPNGHKKQRIALRRFRPYPGILIGQETSNSEDEDENRNRRIEGIDIDVSGLDVLIVLVRQLLSFGFESRLEATPAEKDVVDAARRDVGWDMDEDWNLKTRVLQSIFPNSSLDKGFFRKPIHLAELLSQPTLHHILCQGPFAVIGSHGYLIPGTMDTVI